MLPCEIPAEPILMIGDAHQKILSRLKQLIFREATNVSPQSDVISRRDL